MAAVHTICHDWDGCLAENVWPRMGDWNHGAVDACFNLHNAGLAQIINSARLSPYDPYTSQERDPSFVASEYQQMRAMLDTAGLTFVDIWRKPGKPGASVYIDDKAERYHGRPGSWKALTHKILTRLDVDEALFPRFDQEVTE